MNPCGEHKNPLQHGGTSQQMRYAKALDKHYVLPDEKTLAQRIWFAQQYAKFVKFYDVQGAYGNWEVFFATDISARLALAAVQDAEALRREILIRLDFLKSKDNNADTAGLKKNLSELFGIVYTLAFSIDTYLNNLKQATGGINSDLSDKLSVITEVNNLIEHRLAFPLRFFTAWYKAASEDLNYIAPVDTDQLIIFNQKLTDTDVILHINKLSILWQTDKTATWDNYITDIENDNSIFNPVQLVTVFERIQHAANHNLFTHVFDVFIQAYTSIISHSSRQLAITLNEWNEHTPHYALFLAFVQLFEITQSSLNTLTQRHLDFYYKDILRLFPKRETPASAHILIELSKQVQDYAIEQKTRYLAGKDSAGVPVHYVQNAETVFNKAQAVLFQSVYLGSSTDNHPADVNNSGSPIINNNARLFAAPVINSADGLGAELQSANKEWHPFVNRRFDNLQLADITMPHANIGMAFASHYLYLEEGYRVIQIRIVSSDNERLSTLQLQAKITIEKEWYQPETSVVITTGATTTGQTCVQIEIILTGNEPAISIYDSKVHGGVFDVQLPILQLFLVNDEQIPYNYVGLADITISSVEIFTQTGVTGDLQKKGVRNLLLANDAGTLDGSKAFMPFGSQPEKDQSIFIGSREVFTKQNAAIQFEVEWANLPGASQIKFDTDDSISVSNVSVRFLSNGVWDAHNDGSLNSISIFNGSNKNVTIFTTAYEIPDESVCDFANLYSPLQAGTKKGFLKASLNEGFGFNDYLHAFILHNAAIADNPDTAGPPPAKPYTPLISSLYLNYTATAKVELTDATENNFQKRSIHFFHLYPFGIAEQHAYLHEGKPVFVLPQFNHPDPLDDTIAVTHIGELYIGFENFNAGQAVNVLFQVLDGTADPLKAKPKPHLHWSYLSDNEWIVFKNEEISDATAEWLQSGIIQFKIPSAISLQSTLLPSTYTWMRAAIDTTPEAVCKLIGIHAQAAGITYQNQNNAPDFLRTVLAPSSISKLVTPLASVKKIIQPYSGFGGRPEEDEADYYKRVCERLRHKSRAITIWDYEHIVLEAFPSVYKAKCLNHTQWQQEADGITIRYNENAPGYTTVALVPYTTTHGDANPLKPYASLGLLESVKAYLSKIISCHVKLAVINPQYETVRLQFELKLADGYADFTFYSRKLQDEIINFLAPWAFEQSRDIAFGGVIHKSVLINFIEEKEYVNYITNVKMFHIVSDTEPESIDLDSITASTARSILVPAVAAMHIITEIPALVENISNTCVK